MLSGIFLWSYNFILQKVYIIFAVITNVLTMKALLKIFFYLLIIQFISCSNSHFIKDEKERKTIESDFEAKRNLMSDGNLFSVFDLKMPENEKEALMFLYAYMPVSDIADYSGDFHLENVRLSFEAQAEMTWGKNIPDREFRHFVLPVRVNNENLDNSRKVFYGELKDRIKDMNMYDAVLEVNHWCHEKAIYMPSDARTSSPLATVRTAYGRCGEESVLLVAALRSVGIPARQVYTPRWAHTDSNHAWVEAWVDGEWYFLGACEPEPVLNLGWFNAPASRGMLMHTKVFGKYNGPEEVIKVTPCYTEISVIDNYASSAKAEVIIIDEKGNPVENAKVDFKVYNYAQFYTVASKQSDVNGKTSLTAGKGDMLVWASKDGRFGYSKLSFGKEDNISIKLDKTEGELYDITIDITPPDESPNAVEVSDEQRKENDRRMLQEDSIRRAYTSTFMDMQRVGELSKQFAPDTVGLAAILVASRGNHNEIASFLKNAPNEGKHIALELLKVISEKDLRDVPELVLNDHLTNTNPEESVFFYDYILNPRVGYEMLTPYRSFFLREINDTLKKDIRNNPEVFVEWCRNNITVVDDMNFENCPVSPEGVWRSRLSDTNSRNIFFVSVLRSLGIPARIDKITGKLQYIRSERWVDVGFDKSNIQVSEKGRLVLTYSPTKILKDPDYYSHFTISKFDEGVFKVLGFNSQQNSSWQGLMQAPLELDAGYYMLVTGTRLAKGGVLSRVSFFNIDPGQTTTIKLIMRESSDQVQVIGTVDSEAKYTDRDKVEQSILQISGRGYFIVAVLNPGQEPTNHALRDIAALKDEFEQWGRSIILLFPDEQKLKNFDPSDYSGLPKTITYGIDEDGKILKMIKESNGLTDNNLPLFVIGDTFNRAVFISQGYTIGLGEQLMKVIHKL